MEAGNPGESNRTSGGLNNNLLSSTILFCNITKNYKERQVTGLWKKFQHYSPPTSKQKDPNNFVLEVAAGHRYGK